MCSSTVNPYLSTSSFSFYNIGLYPLSVVYVYYCNFLVFIQTGGIDEILIYCYTAYVIEICFSNLCSVDFGFKYLELHVISVLYCQLTLLLRQKLQYKAVYFLP